MQLRNTESRFGAISQLFHWGIAILIFIQYYLVYWKEWVLPPKSPLASFYINGLHKPIGVIVLFLAFLAVFWRISNPRPTFPTTMANWEKYAARLTHSLLALSLFIMPISGLIMSTAAGYPPNFFGLYQFPAFIAPNKTLSHIFFDIHAIASYILIGIIILHTLAAFKHHFVDKDTVLKRMLPFSKIFN